MDLDRDACYRALRTRDARFDGRFYTAVVTTGIYCRPICPARPPKIEHCLFLPSAAAAHQAGFRPCLRCRPELAPGVAGWGGAERTVSHALDLIVEGALENGGIEALAARLGITGRQLRRLFDKHLGASPVTVAQAHRILFAKKLIGETAMSMADIAYASGFGSVRRFNDAMRRTYDRPPRELRRAAPTEDTGVCGITLKLPFRVPYNWAATMSFLGPRAIPGVEAVGADCYRRIVSLDNARGIIEVRPVERTSHLLATIRVTDVTALGAIVGRLRRLFDLDADVAAIESHLRRDPRLATCIAARPGVRVPGAWDGFELAVRAILGQQISVAAATTLAGRLAAAYGETVTADQHMGAAAGLRVAFPRPDVLAGADLTPIGLPRARAAAISALAAAVLADADLLQPTAGLEATVERLCRVPGVGEWTAQYIAMRALHQPDAFPATDLGVLRAMASPTARVTPARVSDIARAWRPWRAYAVMHLWLRDTPAAIERRKAHEPTDRPRRVGDRDHPDHLRRSTAVRPRL
ncbi:MAG TPA: AlkA N-terminal domain-containing protein [bacterium]|nr:AlkA N-terminal domain-containing protein [bacterium]